MKHQNILKGKQAYAKRNRGAGILNWKLLAKRFPDYHEHIYRVRNNYAKLVALRNRLVVTFGIVGNLVYKRANDKS